MRSQLVSSAENWVRKVSPVSIVTARHQNDTSRRRKRRKYCASILITDVARGAHGKHREPTTMSSASTILDPTVEVFDEQIEAVEVKSIARGSIDMLISESYQAPLLVLVSHLFENSIFC